MRSTKRRIFVTLIAAALILASLAMPAVAVERKDEAIAIKQTDETWLHDSGEYHGDNQTYNTHIDNLANAQSNPGNDISSIGAVPEPAVPAAVTDRLDCVSKVSASLVLDSTTTIRCKITDPLCHDAAAFEEKYDFSVDGDDMRCSYLGDNTYAIELPGLAASELSHPYTFSVTAGGKTMKIRYSGLAYAYNTCTKSADSKLRALCLTLYAYAKAAATIWPEA